MAAVPIVIVDGVSKRFTVRKDKSLKERVVNAALSRTHAETFEALRDITLTIDSGSMVGLIGPNGSGKSTLLKTIGGIVQPSTGSVRRRGRMAALLELGAGFHPDLTGRENVYLNASILGLSERQTSQYFDAIVDFSGIEDFIDSQVKFYSSGMYVRLAFAVAVHVDPDLLLVDEVLAVGDEAFQRKCLNKIRSFQLEGRTIVLVTHTLSQITELCTRSVVLSKGSLVFDGNPADAVAVLRAGYQSQREVQEARALEAALEAARPPKKRVEIAAIRVLGTSGAPITRAAPGDDISVEVDIEAEDRVSAWRLGVSFANTFGQPALVTNTERLGIDGSQELHGSQRVLFRMPAFQMGEGDYRISAALEHLDRTELARMHEGAKLTMHGDGRYSGPTHTTVEARLIADEG